jgi:hypothetical protein
MSDDLRGYRFGGLGTGRVLGSLGPLERPQVDRYAREDDVTDTPAPRHLPDDVAGRIADDAVALIQRGKIPVVVEYKSPQERANDTAWRSVRSGLIALVLAVVPLLISFLTVGDFGRDALVALGTGVGIAVLMVILNWAQKHNESKIDDASGGAV